MIYVDISVPSFDKVYDFNLDEYAKIDVIIKEIIEMVCKREQCELTGNMSEMMLVVVDSQCILKRNKALKECGVHTGSKLILV